MYKTNRFRSVIIATVGLVFLFAASVPAQQQTGETHSPNADAPATITEKELDKAALAFAKISEISAKLQSSLQMAENQEEQQQMQQSANAMMLEEVKNAGLTVERYNEIIQHTQADEERVTQFQQRVEELKEE